MKLSCLKPADFQITGSTIIFTIVSVEWKNEFSIKKKKKKNIFSSSKLIMREWFFVDFVFVSFFAFRKHNSRKAHQITHWSFREHKKKS